MFISSGLFQSVCVFFFICSLNMICLGVACHFNFCLFWHLSCLIFSEFPGSVVQHLTFIWKILSHYCFKYYFYFLLFFFFLYYSHSIYVIHFVVVSQFLDVLLSFFCSFSPYFSVCDIVIDISSTLLLTYPQAQRSFFFLSHNQSTNKPIKGNLYSYCSVFDL